MFQVTERIAPQVVVSLPSSRGEIAHFLHQISVERMSLTQFENILGQSLYYAVSRHQRPDNFSDEEIVKLLVQATNSEHAVRFMTTALTEIILQLQIAEQVNDEYNIQRLQETALGCIRIMVAEDFNPQYVLNRLLQFDVNGL